MSGNCPDPPRQPAADDDQSLVTGTDRTVMVEALSSLGPYRLTKVLGRGGMGEVWQALDSNLERDVAVKLMRKELLANEEAVKRFAREARAVARLNHSNIVQVYAFGDQDGILYFVMELVEGETITQRMKRCGNIALQESVFMLLQAVEGLSYANARGIIHRDIKPSNLMLTPDFRVKVADFGLAKMVEQDTQMTAAGTTMGSPNYMSPEQARGEEADHRSDIYALGISWYQMLTGELPFTAQSPLSVLLKQIQDPLPEPENLKAIAEGRALEVIKKMTAKNPDERYQTYGGLAAAISALAPDVRVKGSHVATTSMPASSPGDARAGAQGTDVLAPASGEVAESKNPRVVMPPPPPPPASAARAGGEAGSRSRPWLIAAAIFATGSVVAVAGMYAYRVSRPVDYKVTQLPAPPATLPVQASPTPVSSPAAATPTPITQTVIIYATPTPLAPTPVITQVTPLAPAIQPTYVPTPSPTPYAVSQLVIGPNLPEGSPVAVTSEAGEQIGSLPAGTRMAYNRVVGGGDSARYQIDFGGRAGYVAAGNASSTFTDAATAAAAGAVLPVRQVMLELIVPGASAGEVEIFRTDRPVNSTRRLPAGTAIQKTGETASMYRVLLPDGKQGWVLRASAREK